jgi:hypothetical protein
MAKLNLNLGDKLPVEEKPVVQKEAPVEKPKFKQRIPSDWEIKPGNKTEIVAKSNQGDTFEGTIAEFNKLLRA